jgi:type VI secretion system protein ImpL
MFSFLRRRAFLVAVGLALAAVFIWFAGPYFSFAEWYPLESELSRIIAILAVVAAWAALAVLKKVRAQRTGDQLAAAVVKQSQRDERPSADVVQLRERFEEAIATLTQKRRGRQTIYELPWYVIIGAPGAGKTTALVNSGLHFPLEQRSGKGALRGVGGTRNCDWWFTDEAVFLDTAGRYTTQDSDATADAGGWVEFLGLLKKYRKRRPVNGVILAISAHDLMVQGNSGREAHVSAARRRLTELNKELKIHLPVYVLVTKCDLVSGFMEYFDDVVQEGRTQVWGVTFPYDVTQSGGAAKVFPAEFDALMTRLNERVFARLEDDRDVRRRAKVFGFPQQMAALKNTLDGFITDLFEATRFDQRLLLRGVYFTSGTQEGTPIDRLLGALGRRFSLPAEAVSTGSRGKAFFIERLLKDVMLAESGLAGVNRRIELKKAAAQLGAYAALVLVAVIGLIGMSVSYSRNRAYINDVAADVAGLSAPAPASGTSLEKLLPRLAAVESVVASADRHRAGVPWGMTWGLYQGTTLGDAARDAYSRELDGALLEQVAARVRQRLSDYTGDPILLFLYLKAYLMLDQPEHLDKQYLGAIAAREWASAYKDNPQAGEDLSRHFAKLLEYEGQLRRIPADAVLVEKARRTLPADAVPRLIYSQIKDAYGRDTTNVVRLDSLGGDRVFKRKSGTKLSEPISALFSKEGFNQVVSKDADDLEGQFAADRWVWGESSLSPMASARLKNAVVDLYESDYIATWEGVLNDIDLSASSGSAEAARVLRSLSGTTSPFRELLKLVDKHTYLVATDKPTDVIGKMQKPVTEFLKKGQKAIGITAATPGARVTARFASIHQLMAGEPGKAPIDAILAQLQQIGDKLQPLDQIGGPDKVATLAQVGQLSEQLKQDAAALPKPVGRIVAEAGSLAQAALRSGLGGDLQGRYKRDVFDVCRAAIEDRYPFGGSSLPDVLIADFGRVFGFGGTYDQFFKTYLEQLVNTSGTTWAWRPDASGIAVGVPGGALTKFQQARQIRDTFFPPGAQKPEVVFRVMYTSAGLDGSFTRSSLEIDGTPVNYSHGPEIEREVTWQVPRRLAQRLVWFRNRELPRRRSPRRGRGRCFA